MRSRCSSACCWDHLRVCGADESPTAVFRAAGGSPPRVRSRRDAGGVLHGVPVDHLRVCGADRLTCNPIADIDWITSACAEQTASAKATT